MIFKVTKQPTRNESILQKTQIFHIPCMMFNCCIISYINVSPISPDLNKGIKKLRFAYSQTPGLGNILDSKPSSKTSFIDSEAHLQLRWMADQYTLTEVWILERVERAAVWRWCYILVHALVKGRLDGDRTKDPKDSTGFLWPLHKLVDWMKSIHPPFVS